MSQALRLKKERDRMSSNGQIIDPTKPKFHQQWIPGPLAQSTSVTMQTPTGAQVVTFSGKSLLLDVAQGLLSAMLANQSQAMITESTPNPVDVSLALAERLINGSFERMQRGGKDDVCANEE
jgi:hypothetical protein